MGPPKPSLGPLDVPDRLLMGPGPSNASQRILAAMTKPLLGHLHPEFIQIMDEVKAGLRYVFQTESDVVCCFSGTGHAGMEAVISNLLEGDDVLLIGKNGHWGDRVYDMAQRQNITARFIEKDPGECFSLDDIERGVKEHKARVLFLIHVDSSTGVVQNMEGIGRMCHEHGCLLVVDTVASLGGVPFHMDEMEVDVAYTGTQKVLGAPPSLSPVAFSQLAMNKVRNRKRPPSSYYFDIKHLANYWGCDEGPRRYHHTGPISAIYALREALAIACEEGLQQLWARHENSARHLRIGLTQMGLTLFVGKEADRSPTITTLVVPDGVAWKEVTRSIMQRHGIEISGGLGPTVGKVFRIGLMGLNSNITNVNKILKALREEPSLAPKL